MGLFDRLRPHFCHMPQHEIVRKLTSSNQEERRQTLLDLMDAFKVRVSDEKHRKEARQFTKQLRGARRDLNLAVSHKDLKNHHVVLWISNLTPNSVAIVSTLEFRELNFLLNALEWIQQVTCKFTTHCDSCNNQVSARAAVPGAGAMCPECGTEVVRWLYSSDGHPVAYLLGEHVFKLSGDHMGNLEANQIWTDDYEGEILLDDRVMIDYHWRGPRRHSYESATSHLDPPVPSSKQPKINTNVGKNEYADIRAR